MRRWVTTGVVAGFILGLVGTAQAVSLLKFDDPVTPAGTISFAGGGINGSGIAFQSIQRLDDGVPVGNTLTCVGCTLNFVTNIATVTDMSPSQIVITAIPGPSLYEIVTTGGVFDGATQIVPANKTLLTGDFTGGQPTAIIDLLTGFTLFQGMGSDTKHPDLFAFFGLTGAFSFATTEIGLTSGTVDPTTGFFTANINNSDLNNIFTPGVGTPVSAPLIPGIGTPVSAPLTPGVATPVSAPLSLVLVGLGLVGLAASRRQLGR
jgi:hypothetical protein